MISHQNEFYLVGRKGRTNNKAEMAGHGFIAHMWEQVFKDNLKARIGATVGEEVYAVYSNYESDENGDYDYFIGYRVKDIRNIPQGLTMMTVLAGRYQKFETKKGSIYQVVPETWMEIWQTMGGKRSFKTDFEIYGSKAQNPQESIVDIFIGLRDNP